MENPRPDKVAVVDEVRERLSNTEAAVLTEYRGLDVPALAELRAALREAGGEYKVYKNTLVRLAVGELDFEIDDLLTGPTAIALVGQRPDGSAGDAVSLAKALDEFAKEHEALVIKGGLLDSQRLTVEQVKALAKIAPREVLLAQLAGAMAAPMQQFASLLNALPQNLAYALKALIDERGGPVAPADAEEAPADDEEVVAEEAPAEDADVEGEAVEAAADDTDADAVAEEAPADDEETVADEAPVEDTDVEAVADEVSADDTDADAVAEEAPADDNDAEAEEAPADEQGATAEEAEADTDTAAADDTEEA
ncbi:MAG: 50S ribosomal protein L10 [Acidimicrobiia bacterium]|nr:50S ribosomal protein L10 [Actinomycetota bacterium]MBL6924555.1 50S ribosomal protein L10 [Acidimicrobiia bacterium]MBL6926152.1 50S ribosomal protein L10 [Acidimicrobiia bacterium]